MDTFPKWLVVVLWIIGIMFVVKLVLLVIGGIALLIDAVKSKKVA